MDMARPIAIAFAWALIGAFAPLSTYALDVARLVTAEEITGVVVEAATGKPIPDAIVAIRFERNNTGHAGPHCFRSMAVQTSAEGRFRFAPWKQENTHANYAMGEVTAYKAGYSEPRGAVYVKQSRRSIGPVALSSTITIPKTEVRVELRPFGGGDEDRIKELGRLADNFSCRGQAEFDDMILLFAIRDEIVSAPFASQTPRGWDSTVSRWIDAVIKLKTSK